MKLRALLFDRYFGTIFHIRTRREDEALADFRLRKWDEDDGQSGCGRVEDMKAARGT